MALPEIGFTVGLTIDSKRNEQMIDNLEVKNDDSKTWLSALPELQKGLNVMILLQKYAANTTIGEEVQGPAAKMILHYVQTLMALNETPTAEKIRKDLDQLAPPDSYIKFHHLLDLLGKDGSGKDVEIEYLAVQKGVVVGTYAFLGLRAGHNLANAVSAIRKIRSSRALTLLRIANQNDKATMEVGNALIAADKSVTMKGAVTSLE